MRQSWKYLAVSAVCLLSLLAAGSQSELVSCARNIVLNGQFDTSVDSWGPASGFGFAFWDREDSGSSPSSGSIHLVNNSGTPSQNATVSQCEPILGGTTYDLSAKIEPLNFCCVVTGISPASVRQPLHTGQLYVLLNFYSKSSCGGAPVFNFVRLDALGRNAWQSLGQTFTAPASAVSVRTTLGVFKSEPGDTLESLFDDVSIAVSGPAPSPDSLCLSSGRFDARATWTTRDGQSGAAHPVRLTTDTGYFWFFSPSNVEMIVKVLNGCPLNSRFWAFAGGLTDVQVELTVTDTSTGAVRTYDNPQGTAFLPIQDAAAFASCDASLLTGETASHSPRASPSAVAARDDPPPLSRDDAPTRLQSQAERTGCVAFGGTLCLNQKRFAVTAQWTTPDGQTGNGTAVAVTPDTGYFWFFSPNNVEMIVKVLNGCGFDQSYWVFAGGLTNVNVVMTVYDTQTGATKTYTNPQGTAFAPIQDITAFPACP